MDIKLVFKILRTAQQLRGHERWTRAQLETYQAEALRRLRDFAYARSPFYQRFHQGQFDRPLAELPVLTKAMLMENFDDLVTDRAIQLEAVRDFATARLDNRLFLERYWVTATSGSSGQPGFFLFNESEWLALIASFARGQAWAGAGINLLRRRKMATVASVSPWHLSSQVAVTGNTWWTPSIRLAASDPLETLVRRLNAYQPDQLIAYASMARILAEEQLAGRLQIQPGTIFTSSEVLTAETRRRVKSAWGAEPFNQYGATETADIAAEYQSCRHMHLFEDLVIAEVVDEQHRPVPPGTYGAKLLVTTLFSRTQPLIRYEMNDSVRLTPDSCQSGLPFAILESVQGRVEDTLWLPTPTGARKAVQPLVFNRIMDILPVSGWQVIQENDDGLTVLVSGVHGEFVDTAIEDQLASGLAAQGVRIPHISIQRVPVIPKTSAGKAPLIRAYHSPRS